jgi:hypothetical protein
LTESRHWGSAAEFIVREISGYGEVSEVHGGGHDRTRPWSEQDNLKAGGMFPSIRISTLKCSILHMATRIPLEIP